MRLEEAHDIVTGAARGIRDAERRLGAAESRRDDAGIPRVAPCVDRRS